MRYSFLLLCLVLVGHCLADQPFEPLFLTGGVTPIVHHAKHRDVIVLQSAEQFIRFVSDAADDVLLCFVKNDVPFLDKAVALGQRWPAPLRVMVVNTATHSFLVRALARTIGLTEVRTPSLLVCAKGAAVTPLIEAVRDEGDLAQQVVQRFAQAAQQAANKRPWFFAGWWQTGSAWGQVLWGKISRSLFG